MSMDDFLKLIAEYNPQAWIREISASLAVIFAIFLYSRWRALQKSVLRLHNELGAMDAKLTQRMDQLEKDVNTIGGAMREDLNGLYSRLFELERSLGNVNNELQVVSLRTNSQANLLEEACPRLILTPTVRMLRKDPSPEIELPTESQDLAMDSSTTIPQVTLPDDTNQDSFTDHRLIESTPEMEENDSLSSDSREVTPYCWERETSIESRVSPRNEGEKPQEDGQLSLLNLRLHESSPQLTLATDSSKSSDETTHTPFIKARPKLNNSVGSPSKSFDDLVITKKGRADTLKKERRRTISLTSGKKIATSLKSSLDQPAEKGNGDYEILEQRDSLPELHAPKSKEEIQEMGRAMSQVKDALHQATAECSPERTQQEETSETPRGKRTFIAKEILETERFYVENLERLCNFFVHPLMESAKSNDPEERIMSVEDVKNIFSSIEVIKNYNEFFLQNLERRMSDWSETSQRIGDIFLEVSLWLRTYSTYINNYTLAINTLNNLEKNCPKFQNFMKRPETKQALGKDDLRSFLILPIQRIPRYILLLKDLVKNTPEDHPDYKDLSEALKKMQELAAEVNTAKKDAENLEKCYLLTCKIAKLPEDASLIGPARKYIMDGFFCRPPHPHAPSIYLILFTDALLECKADMNDETAILANQYYEVQAKKAEHSLNAISEGVLLEFKKLYGIMTVVTEDVEKCNLGIKFSKDLMIYCKNIEEKEKWIHSVREQQKLFVSKKNQHNLAKNSGNLHRRSLKVMAGKIKNLITE